MQRFVLKCGISIIYKPPTQIHSFDFFKDTHAYTMSVRNHDIWKMTEDKSKIMHHAITKI